MPKVIACDGQTITFEYLHLPEEFRLHSLIKYAESDLQEIIVKTGMAAALFHTLCAGTKYIHGDFRVGNIFVFPERVILIDCEFPPIHIDSRGNRFDKQKPEITYRSSKELDLASLIVSSFVTNGTGWKMYKQINTHMHTILLDSYKKAGGAYCELKFYQCLRATIDSQYRGIFRGGA